MNAIQAAILGLIQGLAEFLPISSSGHLIIGAEILGLPAPGLSFSVLVHLGTALATIVMLHGEIAWLARGLVAPSGRDHRARALGILGLLIVASIPGALVGVFAAGYIEKAFSSPIVAALGLCVTAIVLYATRERRHSRRRDGGYTFEREMLHSVDLGRAATVGLAQAVAITPGISRSGMTMAAGLFSGMSREDSARFSFLLALPAVLGGAFLDYRAASAAGISMFSTDGLIGAAVAFVSGLFALAAVFRAVRKGALSRYAYYCFIAGVSSLVWLLTWKR
ncbi:MAG: undecaprenyl-diphosphate phosphatase [Bacillota bacterium]